MKIGGFIIWRNNWRVVGRVAGRGAGIVSIWNLEHRGGSEEEEKEWSVGEHGGSSRTITWSTYVRGDLPNSGSDQKQEQGIRTR